MTSRPFLPGRWLALIVIAAIAASVAEAPPAHAQPAQYRLLILTPQEFKLPLMLFSSHKDASGMPTLIVTVEDIGSSPAYAAGRDIQEKIKLAIDALRKAHGIRYVMLVGDADKFPVRYTRGWDSVTSGHFYAPNDLYYANLVNKADSDSWDNPDTGLFDNWDRNANNFFGEMGRRDGQSRNWGELNADRVDLKPDVAVGRLPVSNATELSTLLAKIIVYEQQAAGSAWSKKILLVTGDFDDPHPTANDIGQRLAPLGFQATKRYWINDWTQYATLEQRENLLAQEFDSGYGFVVYLGHGSRLSWNGWLGLAAIRNLNNHPRLPIVIAAACDTAMFHYEDTAFWTKSGEAYACRAEDDIFNRDASFKMRQNADGTVALESSNFPGHFVAPRAGGLGIATEGAIGFRVSPAQLPAMTLDLYWRSLQSVNYPNHFVRHRFFAGSLTQVSSDLDRMDATFRLVPGLAPPSGAGAAQYVSFEAWNYPGFFLVDENGSLVLRLRPTCDREFDRLATFRQVGGLADTSAYSFESSLRAGRYIRHRNFALYVEAGQGDLFKKDASFRLTAPRWSPSPSYLSLKRGDNAYLMVRWDATANEYLAVTGPLTTEADRATATFRKVPGLSEPQNTALFSLEALMPEIVGDNVRTRSRPAFYVRHQGFVLKATERLLQRLKNRPEPAAVQPTGYDLDSMAEEFVAKGKSGAVAYLGSYTVVQPVSFDYARAFFEEYAVSTAPVILGDVWMKTIARYIRDVFPRIDAYLAMENWYAAGIYHAPQKMVLFGDPSLRVGGLPGR